MSGAVLSEKKLFRDGLQPYHYLVLVVACLGWSFDTLDQWLYVFVKQHALRELLAISPPGGGWLDFFKGLFAFSAAGNGAARIPADISIGEISRYTGYAQSALLLGWAAGGLLFGVIGDRLGRTRTMAITILMYAGFTGLSGLAQNWQQFAFLRFLTGMGVGGEFAAGAALVAESFPDHSRATALSIVQATSALGNIAASLINMTIAQYADPATAWRWVFAIGIIPALLVVIIFFFIREPDKWKQSRAEAKRLGIKESPFGTMTALFKEPVIRRNTFVGVGLASVGVIGFWGISTWSPELIRNMLKTSEPGLLPAAIEMRVSIVGMAQNLGAFLGALVFGVLANRIGRRPAFAIALIACFVEIPITFLFAKTMVTATILCFGMGFVLLLLLGGFAVYFPELYPTRLRATGTGFCYNVARFVSAASPGMLGSLSAKMGTNGVQKAAAMLSCIFLLGLLVLPFAPETKDKPLPE